jgi:hypothetical protein
VLYSLLRQTGIDHDLCRIPGAQSCKDMHQCRTLCAQFTNYELCLNASVYSHVQNRIYAELPVHKHVQIIIYAKWPVHKHAQIIINVELPVHKHVKTRIYAELPVHKHVGIIIYAELPVHKQCTDHDLC